MCDFDSVWFEQTLTAFPRGFSHHINNQSSIKLTTQASNQISIKIQLKRFLFAFN